MLLKNFKDGTLKDVYVDSYFTERRSFDDLRATLSKIDTLDAGYDQINAGEEVSPEFIVRRDLTAADLHSIESKEFGILTFVKAN